MREDANDARDTAANAAEQTPQPNIGEAETQGRDVHDLTRRGVTHGRDVITDAENPEIESHGRTVIDRSHEAEAHGVDVIDLGPREDTPDAPPER